MSIFLQNYVSLTEGSRDVALPSLFNGQWVVGHSENFSASITTMQTVIWIVTFTRHAGPDDVSFATRGWGAPAAPARKI